MTATLSEKALRAMFVPVTYLNLENTNIKAKFFY
jgi:hypothetical protein